jgi:alkylation response protein AidB-like acyl-CoA dehydrogenase
MSAARSLEPNDSVENLRQRVAALVEERIMPLEANRATYDEHENIRLEVLEDVRAEVKRADLWAPQIPRDRGDLSQNIAGMAVLYEEMGRSIFDPVCFNCAAPEIAAGYVAERCSSGSCLSEREGVQWMLGEAALAIQTGQLLV